MNDLLIAVFSFGLGWRTRQLYLHLRKGTNRFKIVHRDK